MISSLKQDSIEFESKNRKRERDGHRAQQYAPSGRDTARHDPYGDDRSSEAMARGPSRYTEPEPRRRGGPAYDDDAMDIDPPPMDPRESGYGRDPRDPRARPAVSAGYVPSGREPYPTASVRDPYAYDSRSDPRMDPRGSDPRYAPSTSGVDYPMTDSRTAYTDPRAAQSAYAPTRGDPYGGLPPQGSAIPRGGRDEPQMFVDPRTGQTVMVAGSRNAPVDPYASSGRRERTTDNYDPPSSRYHR